LLTETGTILGVGISNLINIFNPRSIILGGIVPMKSELVFKAAKEKITSSIFSNYALETNILRSSIEQEGLGSIALVINRLFKEA
jgi:predicted NBD/HSP70 family sugar kinase